MVRRFSDSIRRWPGVATSIVMSVAYLAVLVPAQDFASGAFRAHLAATGNVLWNNMWFGGHPLPAYGILSAQLAGIFGVRMLGAVSTVVAAWAFTVLVKRTTASGGRRVALASALFAFCVGTNLWAGRLTFAPSVAFIALTLLALQADRRVLAVLGGCASALTSPVGALFLALILAALWWNGWNRRLVTFVGIFTCAPVVVLFTFFSESGWFPFRWQTFVLAAIGILIVLVAAHDNRIVRSSTSVYALAVLAAFMVKSPLGGNVARLSLLAAGPVAVLFVNRARRMFVAAIVVFSVVWNVVYLPHDRSLTVASARRSFYGPVEKFLHSQPGVHKVEVVPTNTRRESDVLAQEFPLARGWETQVDRERNAVLYSVELDSASYRAWIDDNAVSIIAVPRREMHAIARAEGKLVASMSGDFTMVFQDVDWNVYTVRQPVPLASNNAEVIEVTAQKIRLRAPTPGDVVVRFRYTPLYEVTAGDACIESDGNGWLRVVVRTPGDITLEVKASWRGLLRREAKCP